MAISLVSAILYPKRPTRACQFQNQKMRIVKGVIRRVARGNTHFRTMRQCTTHTKFLQLFRNRTMGKTETITGHEKPHLSSRPSTIFVNYLTEFPEKLRCTETYTIIYQIQNSKTLNTKMGQILESSSAKSHHRQSGNCCHSCTLLGDLYLHSMRARHSCAQTTHSFLRT